MLILFVGLTFVSVSLAAFSTQARGAEANPRTATTRFLIVGKSKVADPQDQQQRGVEAVRKVANAARQAQPGAVVEELSENVMTIEQYRRGQAREQVDGNIFRERLRRLAEATLPQDTVVIYTHSHGCQNGFEKSQPLGGIVMDLPVRQTEHGGTLLWDEYADLLLKIPAKNVVVLTMSCFSGGFVDYLNSPAIAKRWQDRRSKESRNLILLTSQNESLTSGPILKDREVVNPFTYAVSLALKGEADGFALVDGKPAPRQTKDGKLSAGELIDFILYTTENTKSEAPRLSNTAKPKVTGSFDRSDVLFPQIQGAGQPSLSSGGR
jgi:hypothetical protein